jgi:acyl-CoA synthetase (AMP-forming)/AMP-acid ligase II
MEIRTYPEYSVHYPLLLKAIMKRPVGLYPNEIGVVYRNHVTGQYSRFTWLEWYERTCRLANALRNSLGAKPGKALDPGDRVATMALNHHRHLELYYAVPCSGAVLHPINMRLSLDHIVHTIHHAEDRTIFFDDVTLPILEKIYDQIKDTVEKFVYMSDKPGLPDTRIESIYEYEKLLEEQPSEFAWPDLSEDNYATMCYTTATTGLPKGVMFTHRQLFLQTLFIMADSNLNSDPNIERLGENGVPLLIVPMFHAHGWGMPFTYVYTATKIVLPGTFTPEGFCDLVQTEKVTGSAFVPTVLSMIIEYPNLDKYDLSSLKNIGVGGAALPLGLKTKAEAMIPGFSATSGYGMTETAPSAIRAFVKKTMKNYPREELDKIRVMPVLGVEVEVVDERGQSVPKDNQTIGEIVIRGPWIMKEYYKDPEKTQAVWYDGWFHTGDVATVDAEGYISIADRMSDMIRSGAEMVPTVLLENLTATAPFVLEATYVGVPDPKWGQRPLAIITLAPGATEDETDLLEYLEMEGVKQGKITKWMLPDFVLIADSIPKTSVGKFNKIEIKRNLNEFVERAKRMHTT